MHTKHTPTSDVYDRRTDVSNLDVSELAMPDNVYDFQLAATKRDHQRSLNSQPIKLTHATIEEHNYVPTSSSAPSPYQFFHVYVHTHSGYRLQIGYITLSSHGYLQTARAVVFPDPCDQSNFEILTTEAEEGPGEDNLLAAIDILLHYCSVHLDVTASTFLLDKEAKVIDDLVDDVDMI